MDKNTEKHILNILRQGTITWHGRSTCINKYSKKLNVGKYKNGKIKFKKVTQCQNCKDWFSPSDIEVDHIEEIGPFKGNFDEYIKKMYCSQDNLQPLCIKCHQRKSSRFNSTLTFKRKSFKEL